MILKIILDLKEYQKELIRLISLITRSDDMKIIGLTHISIMELTIVPTVYEACYF